MDFLTQVALGGVIGHAVGNSNTKTPLGKKAVVVGALLGALPDADVLIQFGNDLNNFVYHRSFSHSLLMLTALSMCLFFITTAFLRPYLKKHTISSPRLLLLIALPLLTHPILDSFTVYGTQLFWPFFTDLNGRSPESWSTLFIIDPLYSIPLFIAFYLSFARPLKVKASNIALGFSCFYLAFTLIVKSIIDSHVVVLKEENALSNASFFSTPTPFNTLLWRAVIMQDNHYRIAYINIFNKEKAVLSPPIEHNKQVLTSQNTNALKKLNWFSHGFYRLDENDDYIIATDLRMGIENAYVFRFAIERKPGVKQEKKLPFKLKNDIDLNKLKDIYTHF